MILIGIGANLDHPAHGDPRSTCEAALAFLARPDLIVKRRSRWYRSAPVPVSDQPWFVNAVVELETALTPEALLQRLHGVEAQFGRVRHARDEARVLDLDLLAYHDLVRPSDRPPQLPHPRLAARAFVVLPLAELAPAWRHPESGETVAALCAALPPGQDIEPMD